MSDRREERAPGPGATSPSGSTGRPGRAALRPDIEGLRAVAVLMVLVFHLRMPGADGGYAGVDVFFVISGFLITGLLLRELSSTGRIDLVTFWARRARRLLPAALLVILLTFLTGWWVLPPTEQPRLAHDSVGATLYVVNWVLAARSVDYLAEDAGASPLQHYWSLSVEEQFYIVWPLLIVLGVLLAGGGRSRRARTVVGILLVGLAASSFLWSVVATTNQPDRAYFVTTTRLWELAAGALLALAVPVVTRWPRALREVLAAAGTVAIVATVVVFSTQTPWPGWAATVPVLGTVAVVAAGTGPGETLGGRLLSLRPLVWIGGLSYAIYLWHWPLIVLAEAHWGELAGPLRAVVGVLAVLLAWGTRHLVEDPVRFHRGLSARPWASLGLTGALMAVVCATALGALSTRPALEDSVATDRPTVTSVDDDADRDHSDDRGDHGEATTAPPRVVVDSGPGTLVADVSAPTWELRPDPQEAFTFSGPLLPDPLLATEDVPRYYDDGCQVDQGDPEPRDCVYADPDGTGEVVMLGDSKAGQWFSAVEAIAEDEGWRLSLYLKSACPFTVAGAEEPECNAFGQAVIDRLGAQDDPPALALLSTGAPRTSELTDGMTEAVAALQDLGTRVVVIRDNPYPPGSRYPCAAENPDDLEVCSFAPRQPQGADVLAALTDRLALESVDLNRWICPPDTECPVAIGDRLVWRQGSHLTDTYVRNLTPFLHRELSRLGVTDRAVEEIGIDDVPARTGDRG